MNFATGKALADGLLDAVKDYVAREIASVKSTSAIRIAELEATVHELQLRIESLERERSGGSKGGRVVRLA